MAVILNYNMVREDNAGMDGSMAWQSAFLLNDGRICSFGTGNHAYNQSNAMRMIDPMASPGNLTTYDDFPWTQDISPLSPASPLDAQGNVIQHDLYVNNYDNHPSIYIPSENKAVWLGHGVFDFTPGVKSWIYGNRPPNSQNWDVFLGDNSFTNAEYNPCVGWSHELNMGVLVGSGNGGSGVDNAYRTIKRRPSGSATPWQTTYGTLSGIPGCHNNRNGGAVVGEYFYFDSGSLSTRAFHKLHIPTITITASLNPPPRAVNEDYPQMVYDQRRRVLVMIGVTVSEFDLFGTQTWTDITPIGWQGFRHVRGVYHPKFDCIFWSGTQINAGTVTNSFFWHKMTFTGTGGSNYRQLAIDPALNAFHGAESGAGTKHVFWQWHPIKRRVYTWGGDWSTGPSDFGEKNDSQPFTTNDPVSPQTYATVSSFRNDQYSIDPYASGSIPWRKEHPYLPRNLSGVREPRPPINCQQALVWDSLRSKFWGIASFIRGAGSYSNDPWAEGTLHSTPTEPPGTWSFAPGVSGSPGTWTLETTNAIVCRTGSTFYEGARLVTGLKDERIGSWVYDPTTDRIFGLGAPDYPLGIFIFVPSTKTYEYRVLSPAGYTFFNASTSIVAVVGDFLYAVAVTKAGSVRHSSLIRINIRNILALLNGAAVPDNSTYYQRFTLPWSLSTGAVWESVQDGGSKWQEHAGVCAVNGKIIVVCSYSGLFNDGFTKLAIFSPDTGLFTSGAAIPGTDTTLAANSWLSLPDSGEVLFGLNTAGYTNLKFWAYSDRFVSGALDTTPPTVSITAPSGGATVSGAAVTVSATAADNIGVVGVQFTLDGVALQSEDQSSPYSIVWNTTSTSNGSHVLRAVARDAAGNTTTSAPITVTVSNITVPPAPTNLRVV